MWWGRWWAYEEQLVQLRRLEVVILAGEWSGSAEVNAHTVVHDVLAVQFLADQDGGFGVPEGNDYAAEGLQWRPGVDGSMAVYEVADGD